MSLQFNCSWGTTQKAFKEERFMLAHSFRNISAPRGGEGMVAGVWCDSYRGAWDQRWV